MFDASVADGVLRLARADTSFLVTGPGGGYRTGGAAYNVTVPKGFGRTDLNEYVAEQLDRAGFESEGPALLTGVAQRHARGARAGDAVAWVTAGLSNPTTLPVDGDSMAGKTTENTDGESETRGKYRPGTVNVFVGTTRHLERGALATLLSGAVEAKTATLRATTGFTGTTSDAVVAATDPAGEPAPFAGSATPVGAVARACVRDALLASLRSHYGGENSIPGSVAAAENGAVVDVDTTILDP